jgi:hypothetical protein
MKDEYYKKVYIRTPEDLPKDPNEYYHVHSMYSLSLICCDINEMNLFKDKGYDWYLLPVAPQENIRSELIKYVDAYIAKVKETGMANISFKKFIDEYLANRPEATPSANDDEKDKK